MRSITRGLGPHRLFGLAVLALVLGAIAGAGPLSARTASAQTPALLTFQKVIVGPDGNPLSPQPTDRSGYQFTLTQGTQVLTTGLTNAAGQVQASISAGNYVLDEVDRPGFNYISTRFFVNGNEQTFVAVPASGTVMIEVRNQVAGTGSITVVKQVLDQNNNVVASAAAANVVFTITGPNNFSQQVTTAATATGTGQVQLTNLAVGQYTITEMVPAGYRIVNAAVSTQGGPAVQASIPPTVQLGAGQSVTVLFNNQQVTGSTVTVTKQIVDVNNNPVAGAPRSGFMFSLTCGTMAAQTATTDVNGVATFSGVPAGTCQLNETVPAGFTFVSGQVGTTTPVTANPGTYTVTAGQPLAINVVNRQGGQTEPIALIAGCNNVALTGPAGTPVSTVAAAVNPANVVEAIWRQVVIGDRLAFQAWSPAPNAPNDFTVTSVQPEAAWICVRSPATLTRPVVR